MGEHLGLRYGSILQEYQYHEQFGLIVPVPLHKQKLRKRGYNQSEHFALGVAAAMKLPARADVLVRTINTSTQTRKDRLNRWQNVEHVFEVKKPEAIAGKHVLIVDDVLTTGATLEACAVALLNAGAAEVSIATIAAA